LEGRKKGRGGKQTDELHGSGEDVAHISIERAIIQDLKEGRLDAEGGVIVIILCRHCGESKRKGERKARQRISQGLEIKGEERKGKKTDH